MFSFLLRAVVGLATLVILTVLAWPELLGLQNTWVVAHAVSFRGVAVAVAIALVLLLGIMLLLARPLRGTTAMLMVLLVAFGAVNAGILLHRGLGSAATGAADAADAAGTAPTDA